MQLGNLAKEARRRNLLVCPLAALLLVLLAYGCAPKVYNIDLRYEPTKVTPPAATDGRRISLTAASFVDKRKIDDPLLVGRVIQRDGDSIPVLPKYVKPAEALADALRRLLVRAGYNVSPERPKWDLRESQLSPSWGAIVVGGSIDELFVTCHEGLTMKKYAAKARLTFVFGDTAKKRIFYRVSAESSSTLEHIVFSEERMEGLINGVLSEAMEKALEGAEVGRRIKEALDS